MPAQVANPAKVEIDASHFQLRNDPGFAWSRAVSHNLYMPKTVGFWPFSALDANLNALDLSGNGQLMTNTGGVDFGLYGITPYAQFDGTNYFTTPSAAINKITGAFAVSCWVWFDDITGAKQIMAKYLVTGNQRSFSLTKNTLHQFDFGVSSNGTTVFHATSTLVAQAGQWYHLIGEFIPSVSVSLWADNNLYQNITAPASMFDSTAALTLGTTSDFSAMLTGRMALARLGRTSINNALARLSFDYARPLFGVTP